MCLILPQLLSFGITLQMLKFPTNVSVHMYKSEKLIFVHFYFLAALFPVLVLETDWFPFRQRMVTL